MRKARFLLPVFMGLACLIALAEPTEIRLGDSFIPLAGPWKFAPGDSPQTNGSLLWASPAFDDTAWSIMDLHANPSEIDAGYGTAGYLKGWTARGFPQLSGFAWYRLRVHLDRSPTHLWLKMPDHTDDAYQVFANGQFVGEFGRFTPSGVDCYRSRPLVFELPTPDEHGDILLAVRLYMEPSVLVISASGDSGGMHQTPLLGLQAQIAFIRAREVTGRILGVLTAVFVAFLMLIAAAGAFWIWLLDRPRPTYLWLTLGLILTATPTAVLLVGLFSYAFTQGVINAAANGLNTLGLVCWILFWRRWFQLARDRRFNFVLTTLAAASVLTGSFGELATHASAPAILLALNLDAACALGLGVMLFVPLAQGARTDRTGAFLALPPTILLAIGLLSTELLNLFHIRTVFFPFGVQIAMVDVAWILVILVTGALVIRRFVASQVSQRLERQAVDQELEQARELQQHVLIPEPVASALFTVETAYHPARTVGGDFFQVIPHADGSLLIVVGDVSGKGIAAAMLVAVLVGAIRTRADESFDPVAVLHTLNERLLGRAGGHFATCIAAHLRSDGAMLVANAGHLPPYRNGIALDLPGSIPLGIISDAGYDVHTIQLGPSDHLTFVTDGVPEARNAAGRLLGFDKLAELSSLPPGAIAQAAIDYGQDDDITIVSVRLRSPAAAVESDLVAKAKS